jgi:HPt (histidine-containing phosphotransfer) domain-containing protein
MEERDVTIDVAALLASVGGDHELLDELTTTFEAERPGWIASLRAGLAAGDAPAVRRVAHSMAGALGYLRAASVRQRAVELEAMGRDGRLDGAGAAIDRLESDLGALSRLLAAARWRR